LSGIEFQMVGAATEKARLAKTVLVRGTASLGAWYAGADVDYYYYYSCKD